MDVIHEVLLCGEARPYRFGRGSGFGTIREGLYAGHGELVARGACDMKFKLRRTPGTANNYDAYFVIMCVPQDMAAQKKAGMNMYLTIISMRPATMLLAGTGEGNAIRFHVADIQHTVSVCMPTEVTAKPLGGGQISVEWQDVCKGGSMTLSPSRE